ncbi:MAG: hypothetical protein II343_06695 [Clostridia bacterium]|nr:hypothetical protein [Clostridia bacterium]
MKGRILFALLFAALIALGIVSLNDLQLERVNLPPQQKTAVYIAAPPASLPESVQDMAANQPPLFLTISPGAPPADFPRIVACREPLLTQRYHIAHYQAFHFSDRAG